MTNFRKATKSPEALAKLLELATMCCFQAGQNKMECGDEKCNSIGCPFYGDDWTGCGEETFHEWLERDVDD